MAVFCGKRRGAAATVAGDEGTQQGGEDVRAFQALLQPWARAAPKITPQLPSFFLHFRNFREKPGPSQRRWVSSEF